MLLLGATLTTVVGVCTRAKRKMEERRKSAAKAATFRRCQRMIPSERMAKSASRKEGAR
jgi:hypothetical protein